MGLAPSEKHLEDWIINNLDDFSAQTNISIHRLIGSQLNSSSGRMDIVLAGAICIWIGELKKVVVNGETVAQVMHYVSDAIFAYGYLQHGYDEDDPHWHSSNAHQDHMTKPVRGFVIGNSITRHAALACLGMDIDYIHYEYDGHTYTFDTDMPDFNSANPMDVIDKDIVYGLREVMRHMRIYEKEPQALKDIYVKEGWVKA